MNSKRSILLAAVALSALLGWATQPLVGRLRARLSHQSVEMNVAALAPGLGQGLTVAAFGGYRNIAANLVWISMYDDWRLRRKEETLSKINLAVALNPNAEFFWIDGARIIANDMPVWEVGDEAMEWLFNSEAGKTVTRRYGELALDFLERAPEPIEQSEAVVREKGIISWQRLHDLDAALGHFKTLVEREDSAYYLSRVYTELLFRAGRAREAYEFLVDHHRDLPKGEPKAMKPIVERRIEELRRYLEETE